MQIINPWQADMSTLSAHCVIYLWQWCSWGWTKRTKKALYMSYMEPGKLNWQIKYMVFICVRRHIVDIWLRNINYHPCLAHSDRLRHSPCPCWCEMLNLRAAISIILNAKGSYAKCVSYLTIYMYICWWLCPECIFDILSSQVKSNLFSNIIISTAFYHGYVIDPVAFKSSLAVVYWTIYHPQYTTPNRN